MSIVIGVVQVRSFDKAVKVHNAIVQVAMAAVAVAAVAGMVRMVEVQEVVPMHDILLVVAAVQVMFILLLRQATIHLHKLMLLIIYNLHN